jgi:hypothetical protein
VCARVSAQSATTASAASSESDGEPPSSSALGDAGSDRIPYSARRLRSIAARPPG